LSGSVDTGVKQIANVAALPGIVGHSVGLPDIHSGYGFAIGNMAAFDFDDPKAVVSPGANPTEHDFPPILHIFVRLSHKYMSFFTTS
jgi:hypothetical protein